MGVNEKVRIWGTGSLYGGLAFFPYILFTAPANYATGFETAAIRATLASVLLIFAVYFYKRKTDNTEKYELAFAFTSLIFSLFQFLLFGLVSGFFYVLDHFASGEESNE